VKIRKIKASDVPYLVRMVKGERAVEDYPGEYSFAMFRQMVSGKYTSCLVAEEDAMPVGFIEFQHDPSAGRVFVWAIMVDKAHRREGLASVLLVKAESAARRLNCVRISYLVRTWNKPMLAFARKYGYRATSTLKLFDKKL